MEVKVFLVLFLLAVQRASSGSLQGAYTNERGSGGNFGGRDGQVSSGDSVGGAPTGGAPVFPSGAPVLPPRLPVVPPLFTGSGAVPSGLPPTSGQAANRRPGILFPGGLGLADDFLGQPGGLFGVFQDRFIEPPQTVTVRNFVTLTDVALISSPVTLTQLVVSTTTHRVDQVVTTPVNNHVAISTSNVVHPTYVTVTDTKSDFRIVTRTLTTHMTMTHTSYSIQHTTFTTTATETVSITSAMIRTVISTQRAVVTDLHRVINTVYVRGGYY